MTTEIGNLLGIVDKRLSGPLNRDAHLRVTEGNATFTANAAGTTTTIVGADPAAGTGMRIGDEFKLFTSAGVLKEETIFRVTGVASAVGTTTVTFTPAAAVATASGDVARLTRLFNYQDNDNLDRRLKAISATSYSDARLRQMTRNDKVYALRVEDDKDVL